MRFPAPVGPHPNAQWNWRPPNPGPRPSFRPRYPVYNNDYRFNNPPGNEEHWCETCDRGFHTEDLLNRHKQEHQKCNIDGCQFIAHPKVITKHIQMQHSSGLYKKIAKLNNPEEIEKWREERRKKYPTKANIDRKAAVVKEKIERGEKMGLHRDGTRREDFKPDQPQGMKRKNFTNNEHQNRNKFKRMNDSGDSKLITSNTNKRPRKRAPEIIPAVEDNRKLKPFSGIVNLVEEESVVEETTSDNNDHLDIEDEDNDVEDAPAIKPVENTTKPVLCGALSSLICDYGSSEDEMETTDSPKETEDHKEYTLKTEIIEHKNENTLSVDSLAGSKQGPSKEGSSLLTNNESLNIDTPAASKQDTSKESLLTNNETNESKEQGNDISNSNNQTEDNDDSGPEEANVEKNEPTAAQMETKSHTQRKVVRKPEERKRPIFHKRTPKLPSTLLHKLLSKEMQKERNIILQCIRHIRKNNYFDNS